MYTQNGEQLFSGSISFEGTSVVGNLLSSECGTCCITSIAETPALILQPELLNFGVQTLNKEVNTFRKTGATSSKRSLKEPRATFIYNFPFV